jgi:thymidylate synthase
MTYKNIHEAYLDALQQVWYFPEFQASPRGMPIREILNYTFTISDPVAEPIVTKDLERNKVIAAYTAKEMELYNSRSNHVEDFAKASKFWEKIANPDGTINSAYGYLIWENKSCGNENYEYTKKHNFEDGGISTRARPIYRSPWQWAKQSLIQDKDTRQAILRFSLPEHQWMGNKDQTCTMHGNFLIRNDKLYFSVVMRSGDLVKGAAYDWPWFVHLMDRMVEELKPTYPNLTKGTYTHTTHSLHIYEKDKETILKMLG